VRDRHWVLLPGDDPAQRLRDEAVRNRLRAVGYEVEIVRM